MLNNAGHLLFWNIYNTSSSNNIQLMIRTTCSTLALCLFLVDFPLMHLNKAKIYEIKRLVKYRGVDHLKIIDDSKQSKIYEKVIPGSILTKAEDKVNGICLILIKFNELDNEFQGTGFFFNRFQIMTAAHVLTHNEVEVKVEDDDRKGEESKEKSKLIKPTVEYVKVLYWRTIYKKNSSHTSLVEFKTYLKYIKIHPLFNHKDEHDIAIINTISPYDKPYNFSKIDTGKEICIKGYPDDDVCHQSVGKIKRLFNDGIDHTASTKGGSSGSPIIQSGKVVGIHTAGYEDPKILLNFGLVIDDLSWIKD
jgi:V8-like Glu-specific endopeptidase